LIEYSVRVVRGKGARGIRGGAVRKKRKRKTSGGHQAGVLEGRSRSSTGDIGDMR
jgi:hypothetical protein